MARGGGQDLPARERSPRRRLPDTAHERKGLPRAETLPSAKASRHGARAKRFTRAGTRSSAKASRHGARAKRFARAGTLSSAKASRHGARAKGFAPRRNAPHGESLPTRRTSKRICPARERSPRRRPPDTARCGGRDLPRAGTLPRRRPPDTAHERKDLPAQERSPRRKPPDTAHEQKNLPRAGTLSSTKASRHGARAKGFAPRRNTPHGEGLPTRRTCERICPRAGTRPSAKASRHGARAKGFAPRRNTPHGEGLPTRREGERICAAQKHAPRRRPPDTAHERKGLSRAETLPTAKASRHGARAKGFAPREFALAPRADERRAALDRRTAGKTPLRRGRTREGAAAAEFIHRKKIRLLHEIQFFYGESHVGSRQIFPSFPSVDRCVARERNLVPPFAPRCGRGHRSLRRDGEMCHGFGEMVRRFGECPHGGEWLPRGGNGWPLGGGRYCPGLRCFGERFHRRRCANPDACRAPRCSHG